MILMTAAILISSLLMAFLAARDPKRLRAHAHVKGSVELARSMSVPMRRVLGAFALIPGVLLGVSGEWWAFLIWTGAVCAVGWLTARVSATQSA